MTYSIRFINKIITRKIIKAGSMSIYRILNLYNTLITYSIRFTTKIITRKIIIAKLISIYKLLNLYNNFFYARVLIIKEVIYK